MVRSLPRRFTPADAVSRAADVHAVADADLSPDGHTPAARANADTLSHADAVAHPAATEMMKLSLELERLLQPLTPRQREVLDLAVSEGLTHKEIALRLGIGRQSVKNHMMAIYDKLCPLRRDLFLAAIEAWRRGEIALPQPMSQRSPFREW